MERNGDVMDLSCNTGIRHFAHEVVSANAAGSSKRSPNHVQMVSARIAAAQLTTMNKRIRSKDPIVARHQLAPASDELIELTKLRYAQRSLDLGYPIVIADLLHFVVPVVGLPVGIRLFP